MKLQLIKVTTKCFLNMLYKILMYVLLFEYATLIILLGLMLAVLILTGDNLEELLYVR